MVKSKKVENPKGLSKDNQCLEPNGESTIGLLLQSIQHFSGPLPSPEILKEYNKILPDAAERIFKMAEKAQDHYEITERKIVDLEIKKVSRGQILAFLIAITGIAGAVVCAFLGQIAIGSIIGGATLISIIPHFITGKRKKKDNDHQKDLEQDLKKIGKGKSG